MLLSLAFVIYMKCAGGTTNLLQLILYSCWLPTNLDKDHNALNVPLKTGGDNQAMTQMMLKFIKRHEAWKVWDIKGEVEAACDGSYRVHFTTSKECVRKCASVPASWPLWWSDPEIFYASDSLAYSSLDGKGLFASYSPHCTCQERSTVRAFPFPHNKWEETQNQKKVTCLFAQTTEQNLFEPLNV